MTKVKKMNRVPDNARAAAKVDHSFDPFFSNGFFSLTIFYRMAYIIDFTTKMPSIDLWKHQVRDAVGYQGDYNNGMVSQFVLMLNSYASVLREHLPA